MATDLAIIYSWFQTGDFPTQQQFQATFSSFYHKDESIPISKIENLEQMFNGTLTTENLQAHFEDPDAHSEYLAKKDASNISEEDKPLWLEKLGILISNAFIDSGLGVEDGNVYSKIQMDEMLLAIKTWLEEHEYAIGTIENFLTSDDTDLDELQELVNAIKQNQQLIEALQNGGAVEDHNVIINSSFVSYGVNLSNQKNLNEKLVADIMTSMAEILEKIDNDQKGAANGVCPLNAHSKIPPQYIPDYGSYEVKSFLISKSVEDETLTTLSMINGNFVSMVLSEPIDETMDRMVFYNGVFIPKSLSTIEPNNTIKIDLTSLGIEPIEGGFFVTKYFKI